AIHVAPPSWAALSHAGMDVRGPSMRAALFAISGPTDRKSAPLPRIHTFVFIRGETGCEMGR
ncbi:MAG: hypothetical protein ABI703_12145, partial [Gemmatimonadales bacterium]